MAEPDGQSTPLVTGVILAAGRSSRFSGARPKQLHRVEGQPLVARTARTALASRLRQIVVVAGHYGAEVGAALAGLAIEVVENPDFAEGQSTSVHAGLSRVEADAEAAMFIPCDLPHLDADTIDRLIATYAESRGPIVVPVFERTRRAPVLIDRSLFAEIETITGDEGARQIFALHEAKIVEVGFASDAPFRDLDRAGH